MNHVDVGKIVHYVGDDLSCVAALVTRVFEPDEGKEDLGQVGLAVFYWCDGTETDISSYYSPDRHIPNTWHWPEVTE